MKTTAASLLLLAATMTPLNAQTLQWASPLPVPDGYEVRLDHSSLDGVGGSAWVINLFNRENLNGFTRIVWLDRQGKALYTNDAPAVMGYTNLVRLVRMTPNELALTITTFQIDVSPTRISQSLNRVQRKGKSVVVRNTDLSSGEFMVGEATLVDRSGFFSLGQANPTGDVLVRRYSNLYPPPR
jgi:hypothetical protein